MIAHFGASMLVETDASNLGLLLVPMRFAHSGHSFGEHVDLGDGPAEIRPPIHHEVDEDPERMACRTAGTLPRGTACGARWFQNHPKPNPENG